jgi:hypothetical protein
MLAVKRSDCPSRGCLLSPNCVSTSVKRLYIKTYRGLASRNTLKEMQFC